MEHWVKKRLSNIGNSQAFNKIVKRGSLSEAYLGSCQTSMMKLFYKNN